MFATLFNKHSYKKTSNKCLLTDTLECSCCGKFVSKLKKCISCNERINCIDCHIESKKCCGLCNKHYAVVYHNKIITLTMERPQ